MQRYLLARVAYLTIKVLHFSLRIRKLGSKIEGPGVAAFWHGEQLPLLGCMPPAPRVVPVSLSQDGRLQAVILQLLKIDTVDGSSSRSGARAAIGLIRHIKRGSVAMIAADGPKGPRGEAKPGAVYVSQKTGTPLWPVGVAVSRCVRIKSSWDQYVIPLPFSRVVMFVGEPLFPEPNTERQALCQQLKVRIDAAMVAAENSL